VLCMYGTCNHRAGGSGARALSVAGGLHRPFEREQVHCLCIAVQVWVGRRLTAKPCLGSRLAHLHEQFVKPPRKVKCALGC